MWDYPKWGRRIFYGSGKSDIEISTGPNTSKLFPKKKEHVNSGLLPTCLKKRDFAPKPQKRNISQSVAFVVFVAFLGTTMLIFEKFKIWAFGKVYGLWGYLQPVKSYGALKSKMGTVTDLSLEILFTNLTQSLKI